uniref:Uncharacterized protein n=1 Tax=Octopus bimaculoides TaxID=37653 RepID=A0A0L8GY28_OCTBM
MFSLFKQKKFRCVTPVRHTHLCSTTTDNWHLSLTMSSLYILAENCLFCFTFYICTCVLCKALLHLLGNLGVNSQIVFI